MNEWDEYWKKQVITIDQEMQYCEQREDIRIFSKYLPRKGTILEAGCGIGIVCSYLSKKTNTQIVGLDTSSEALQLISKGAENNCWFIKGDVNKLPVKDHSFDLVVSLGVIEHLDNPEIAVRDMERVLKKEGILFLSTPNAHCYTHRMVRFLKRCMKTWKIGKEASFSLSQLEDLLSQSLIIETGYFYWGRRPFFKTFKNLLGGVFLKFGSMVYVIAKRKGTPRRK
ncbi:MAG: class I SAM-dependent methyltransferase [Dehalococcoidia bacterium]|nr:MAG: class I SAM-dependent methyltransferase [Dehalococcoidia bacterium]